MLIKAKRRNFHKLSLKNIGWQKKCIINADFKKYIIRLEHWINKAKKVLTATTKNLHFLLDGLVTQYRNKAMFFILPCKFKSFI